jgi:hypothetical protein
MQQPDLKEFVNQSKDLAIFYELIVQGKLKRNVKQFLNMEQSLVKP